MDNIVITAVGDINLSHDIKIYTKKCKDNDYTNLFRYVKKCIFRNQIYQ